MSIKNDIILKAEGLVKEYRRGPEKVTVLRGISFEVKRGEIVIIMGPSGVGKSTLLNLLGTLDVPTSGNVYINDEDVFSYREQQLARFRNSHLSFIFQFHHLMPEFTALENVLMPRMIKGNDWNKERDIAAGLLEDVGLGERIMHRPNQLSGGEQQRVAIARALMNKPQLILADEPTGDLDRANSVALFDLLIGLNEKFGQTFIIVTHNEMFVERAHRSITLLDGSIADNRVLKEVAAR